MKGLIRIKPGISNLFLEACHTRRDTSFGGPQNHESLYNFWFSNSESLSACSLSVTRFDIMFLIYKYSNDSDELSPLRNKR